jgi:hypothetical protein
MDSRPMMNLRRRGQELPDRRVAREVVVVGVGHACSSRRSTRFSQVDVVAAHPGHVGADVEHHVADEVEVVAQVGAVAVLHLFAHQPERVGHGQQVLDQPADAARHDR